jgi:SAM-dependent methyltransferase
VDDTYDPTAYGAEIADEYDELYDHMFETDNAVACLTELAGAGAVLELGIGTGRLALPLVRAGIDVHGVEASPEMVDLLRAKPDGADIPVAIGDFAEVSVPGTFSLVVLAVNTIYALPDQDAQVRCFANAAAHLAPGGRFVLDAWVPDLVQFRDGPSVRPRSVGAKRVALVLAEHDPVRQRITTTQVHLGEAGVRLHPVNHRYAWPSELDLMARLAGLRLQHRWGGWDRTPFVATSTAHVSVYG